MRARLIMPTCLNFESVLEDLLERQQTNLRSVYISVLDLLSLSNLLTLISNTNTYRQR